MQRQGFAKKKFAEAYGRTPWLSFSKNRDGHQWPFLEILLGQQRISYLEYDLAHRLLKNYPSSRQEVALFLCHLMLAAKEGHLCVHAFQEDLNPSVAQLWRNEEGLSPPQEEGRILTQFILEGLKHIPESLITIIDQKDALQPQTPICREGNKFYLQKHWVYETLFLKNLKKHLKTIPSITFNLEHVEQALKQLCQETKLLPEQTQAIFQGCSHPLTLITGGPGTGKTYTAGHLIRVFWQHLSKEQRKNCQIALTAPTGKAAANLQKSLTRVTADLDDFPPLQAKTLHSLLGLKHVATSQEVIHLDADLVVVDESSMIDIRMMAALFEGLKPGARLILLGDKHQLPAVEAGSIFHDLIQLNESPLAIPTVFLSTCMRVELKTLIDFAHKINQGLAQEVLDDLNQSHCQGIKRLKFHEDKKEAQTELVSHLIPHLPTIVKSGQRPEHLYDLFQTIRMLSPVRKGPLGVEALNQAIWLKICQNLPMNGYLAIPIMILTNDYRQELFNGETGVLIRRLPMHSIDKEDYALFPSRSDDPKMRRFSALLLPKYEFAYCLSVHKSQGSEFEHVILVLPEGAELFGREIFYTAVTRARKSLEIYGSDHIIQKTIEHQGLRLSGLEQRVTTKEWIEEASRCEFSRIF